MEEPSGDYELQAGVWIDRPLIPWAERTTQRLNWKTKKLEDKSVWAPVGFRHPPYLVFGREEWGIDIGVWGSEAKGAFPVLISVKLEEGLSYSVICHDLPGMLGLLNSLLPLIHEQERAEAAAAERVHYGVDGCVATGSYDRHCLWCNRSRERIMEQDR
jgi:hypothetical protein